MCDIRNLAKKPWLEKLQTLKESHPPTIILQT